MKIHVIRHSVQKNVCLINYLVHAACEHNLTHIFTFSGRAKYVIVFDYTGTHQLPVRGGGH